MHKHAIAIVFLLLIGCTTQTEVHIFSLGIGDEEILLLSSLLEDSGFSARPNTLPVPPSVVRHTVIFPALVQDFATIELVEAAMQQAGYPNARLIRETQANHSYSTNNIGVYLVNREYRHIQAAAIEDPFALGGASATALTYNYFSECAQGSESQSELNLYPGGVALLEEFVWDEANNEELSIVHEGEWSSDSSTVDVRLFGNGEIAFSIKEHTGSDWFGPFEATTLVSIGSTLEFESCDYTHLRHLDQ